jgi:alkanesulfonate monooxygenase SsuD/methylene tetrahydromethanopterin reductase-like flavin-dependent oxidoreductase (luciferase family)
MNGSVKFGWRVPAFPVDGSHGGSFRDQVFAYLDAIQGRFASAWAADHFVPWHQALDPMTDTLECWTTIAHLAGKYPKLLFGSMVMSQSYRQPALLAKMATTLQMLSGGRFILGLGAGWKQDEFLAYGYDFPSTATRIHQLAEAAQIVRLMWTQPRVTFQGRFYRVKDAICEPKPDPPPPLLIGGGGRKLTLRYVAQHADWWNYPGGTLENYSDLLDVLRAHCEAAGRDYDSIVKTWAAECVAVAPSGEEAQRLAEASVFYTPGHSIAGTPDEVSAQLQRFADLGVQHFILRFADFPRTDSARLFAEEVIPRFGEPA